MTYEEAIRLRSFQNHCTCGGYAWRMNGRSYSQPHMAWCPQHKEYGDWFMALVSGIPQNGNPIAVLRAQLSAKSEDVDSLSQQLAAKDEELVGAMEHEPIAKAHQIRADAAEARVRELEETVHRCLSLENHRELRRLEAENAGLVDALKYYLDTMECEWPDDIVGWLKEQGDRRVAQAAIAARRAD